MYRLFAIDGSHHWWWKSQPVGQLANHISMWLLFIFRWACSELKDYSCHERQDNQVILLWGLTFTHLIPLNSFVPMVAWRTPKRYAVSDGATLGRTLTTWYFKWEITLIKATTAQSKGCNKRDKHLKQFIIAWYGIAPCYRRSSRRLHEISAKNFVGSCFENCCRGRTFPTKARFF